MSLSYHTSTYNIMPMSVNYAYAYKYYASDMTGTPHVRIFFGHQHPPVV